MKLDQKARALVRALEVSKGHRPSAYLVFQSQPDNTSQVAAIVQEANRRPIFQPEGTRARFLDESGGTNGSSTDVLVFVRPLSSMTKDRRQEADKAAERLASELKRDVILLEDEAKTVRDELAEDFKNIYKKVTRLRLSPPELFHVSETAAWLALRCRAPASKTRPGLAVSQRRAAPSDDPDKYIDIVQEALGERLIGAMVGEARAATFEKPGTVRLLVLSGTTFEKPVEDKFVRLVGLSPSGPNFRDLMAQLAGEFRRWLGSPPAALSLPGAEIDGDLVYLRVPQLR